MAEHHAKAVDFVFIIASSQSTNHWTNPAFITSTHLPVTCSIEPSKRILHDFETRRNFPVSVVKQTKKWKKAAHNKSRKSYECWLIALSWLVGRRTDRLTDWRRHHMPRAAHPEQCLQCDHLQK